MRLIRAVIVAVILTTTPVYAANSPADVEREKAKAYLEENQVEIPEEVEYWCEYYGEQYDICPETIEAICWVESRCTPTAQDASKACKGLMQIKPTCHRDRMARLNVQNIFSIQGNIKTGTDYLAELGGTEDIAVSLAIYNGQSEQAIERTRQGEYTGYVKKVLTLSAALERDHGK